MSAVGVREVAYFLSEFMAIRYWLVFSFTWWYRMDDTIRVLDLIHEVKWQVSTEITTDEPDWTLIDTKQLVVKWQVVLSRNACHTWESIMPVPCLCKCQWQAITNGQLGLNDRHSPDFRHVFGQRLLVWLLLYHHHLVTFHFRSWFDLVTVWLILPASVKPQSLLFCLAKALAGSSPVQIGISPPPVRDCLTWDSIWFSPTCRSVSLIDTTMIDQSCQWQFNLGALVRHCSRIKWTIRWKANTPQLSHHESDLNRCDLVMLWFTLAVTTKGLLVSYHWHYHLPL
jgi:hypothetical protein